MPLHPTSRLMAAGNGKPLVDEPCLVLGAKERKQPGLMTKPTESSGNVWSHAIFRLFPLFGGLIAISVKNIF